MRHLALAAFAALILTANGCALMGGVTPLYETTIEEFAPDDHGTYHPTTRVKMRTRHTQEAAQFSWEDERDISEGREYIKKRTLRQDKETDLSVAESLGLARASGTQQLGVEIGGMIGAAFGSYMQVERVRIEEGTRAKLAEIEADMKRLREENERLRAEIEAQHHTEPQHDQQPQP